MRTEIKPICPACDDDITDNNNDLAFDVGVDTGTMTATITCDGCGVDVWVRRERVTFYETELEVGAQAQKGTE